jgi:zinc transport system ATP-binding protein
MAEPVIELRNVSFAYDGAPVLENVTLTVRDRELVSIVGPNGGGKSTLLKIVLGLLKPTSGSVRVFGVSPERARVRVGYVPQFINYDTEFPVTVMDIVLMGRMGAPGWRGFLGWRNRADRAAAAQALEQVDMAAFASRAFAALSGGQRQRVMIARALASSPELLLLDEPTASIDVEVEAKLSHLVADLNERIAIVLVSHDPYFAADMVEHVVCVNRHVAVHPTTPLPGEEVHDFAGQAVRLIRHDRECPDWDHHHD